MRPCKRKMRMRYVQVGVFLNFQSFLLSGETHLEHQTTFSPITMHVLCVDVLNVDFKCSKYWIS